MKKFIELTSLDGRKLYVNIDHIGDIYEMEEITYGYETNSKQKFTKVGVTTHNNGGFRVQESAQEILNLINN